MSELRPCPFCGAGETEVVEKSFWTGMRSVITHVEIQHWCEPQSTQMRSYLKIVGKTHDEAIKSWNGGRGQ